MRKQQGGYALLFSSSSSGSLFFIGQLSGVYVAFTQVPWQFQQQISQYIFITLLNYNKKVTKSQ